MARHRALIRLIVTPLALSACGIFGAVDEPTEEPPADGPPPLRGTPSADELTEAFGVFVTPAGTSGGDGSRERPLGSIASAIALAKAHAKRVYVCTGSYKEAVELENAVSVIGGFDCSRSQWATGAARSNLAAPTSPAVRARAFTKTTRFEGFEVVAPDGSEQAPSSIALLVDHAGTLTVANVGLTAGRGHDGANGEDGAQLTPAGSPAANGINSAGPLNPFGGVVSYPAAASGASSTCNGTAGFTPEHGGYGGRGGVYLCKNAGTPQIPLYRWAVYFDAVQDYKPVAGEPRTGVAGADGKDGQSATSLGMLSADGYKTADGTAGENGEPGKGGRGGNGQGSLQNAPCLSAQDGYVYYASNGGGGGAGGCPGLAGKAGTGGGASIAALVLASPTLELVASTLRAANGGGGGAGTLGSVSSGGSSPGSGEDPAPIPAAPGGGGGRAGVSGSGAGGPSFGLAHTGGAPKLTNTTIKAGAGGEGVPARSMPMRGVTVQLQGSVAGLAEDVHAF